MIWIAPSEKDTDIFAPSLRLICKLQLQTQILHRTRDQLPPRLLSGQVSLKEN